jgi:CelD/BcsL family acetyltransferase involved in cellulose biosynthesis
MAITPNWVVLSGQLRARVIRRLFAANPFVSLMGGSVLMKHLAGVEALKPMQGESGSGICLQLFTDMSAVERAWRAFEPCADSTVFQTFDWLSEWQNRIGAHKNSQPVVVLGRDHDGQILIVLPLAIEDSRFLRRLTWLGSDLCDYNAPMLAANFNQRVTPERFGCLWREIVALVRAEPQLHFDMVDMDKMPEAVGAQRNPMLNLPVLPRTYGAHVATLGDNWENFSSSKRSAATCKRERRQFKHLAEHGEVRFVEAGEPAEIRETMDLLIRQKRNSYARMGVEDLFARAGYRDFYRAVAFNPSLRDVVHVSRLDVGATSAATGLGLRYKACYYLVMSSYQDGDLARFGPGRAHLQQMLRYAIDRKIETFDFTIGDEPYKRDWCDLEVRMFGYIEAATATGRFMVAIRTAMSRGDLFIRERPWLRRPLSRVRAAAMALRRSLRRPAPSAAASQ